MKPNPETIAKDLTPAVDALLMATALAQLEREKVDAVKQNLLDTHIFTMLNDDDTPGPRITSPKYDWRMLDADHKKYCALLNAHFLAEGFTDAKRGICPALQAESTQRDAEQILIKCAETHFEGVTSHRLLCNGIDKRKMYIDLLIKVVVNNPNYKTPNLLEA